MISFTETMFLQQTKKLVKKKKIIKKIFRREMQHIIYKSGLSLII